uniref:Uncharacterized protein n=1 Tax=Anguilla anguilla TaxID=7936 RepID=A0A0E9RCN7_ANGAN
MVLQFEFNLPKFPTSTVA